MIKKILTGVFVIDIVLLNIFTAYTIYQNYFKTSSLTPSFQPVPNGYVDNSDCDKSCQDAIYKEIDNLKTVNTSLLDEELGSMSPSPTPSLVKISQITTSKIKNVTYVPIPGAGSILSTDWIDISGTDFYVSKSDFPGLTGVYFEANFRLQNGNGTANLRLYDKTHSIAPGGGELSTSLQSSTFVSGGPVYLWEGNNHYVVQAKSSTSDTTVFESGRLKVITEN